MTWTFQDDLCGFAAVIGLVLLGALAQWITDRNRVVCHACEGLGFAQIAGRPGSWQRCLHCEGRGTVEK